ncbi:helix-turn-helix domain-containing protein [Marispirochaeta sp.]|jgi:DNA-binding IclR family transcriptional regulator|uniref:IclR family transcriptional regulator n=1 Tax=Marispirochaeta sp. TaxID=2038653 RepID=UPI0029C7A8F7|nr:helix-turn-helix domain-containing protein [Marispirochaeta sp.]
MRKYNVPALDRALDIIEYLGSVNDACPLKVISKDTGKSPSELFRILDCLVRRGYVKKDSKTNNYTLSLKLYSVTNNVPFVKRLVAAATEPMSLLTKQVGESCHISVLEGSDLVVLYEQEGIFPVHIHARPGARIPVSMTSSGKVLLALKDETEQRNILAGDKNYNDESAVFQQYFHSEVSHLHGSLSYVLAPEKLASIGLDIIAPVRLFEDSYAALTLSCLELQNNRKNRKEIKELQHLTEQAAASIEELLGYAVDKNTCGSEDADFLLPDT